MKGTEYAVLVGQYIKHNFGSRGIEVWKEVPLGKSIIGKNRRLDLLVIRPTDQRAFAIECKYQDSKGSVDEKIPYALMDLEALRIHMPGCLVYAGIGMSAGVLQMLQASPYAGFCFPDDQLARSTNTLELDHLLAMNFGWWDLVSGGGKKI